MTLHRIVAVLGGDLYAQGQRANIPAPGHSAHDRSVSLWLTDGRVVAHSFGAADWREVLADLRARGLIDRTGAPVGGGALDPAPPIAPPPRTRIAVAQALWAACGPIRPGSPPARHLLRRGVARPPGSIPDLRDHPQAPVSVFRPGSARRPALVAGVRGADGVITAVELTYLDCRGERERRLHLSRKIVGQLPPEGAVRLDPPGSHLLVAEGVFTALSAGALFALPAWALLSATALARWRPPAGVARVLIAADRDAAGETAAQRLAARLVALGIPADIRTPSPPFGDWNDAALRRGREGG